MADIDTPTVIIKEYGDQEVRNIKDSLKALGTNLDKLYKRHKKEETREIRENIERAINDLQFSVSELSEILEGSDKDSIEQALDYLFVTMNRLGIISQKSYQDLNDLDRLALVESLKHTVRDAKK
jgi:spore cortex formation protein SpoVR/YcgB (stage V sporulation)